MTKNSYHHGDLRNALLDTAITLLQRDGMTGLSLRAIAKAAGVSHSAPYRHFRDKTALLEAIAQTGYEHIRDANQQAMTEYPDDPIQQLYQAGRRYMLLVVKQPEVANLMFSGILPPANWGPALQQAAAEAIDSLKHIIANGNNAGLFADRPLDNVTMTTLCTVHGLSMALASGHFSNLAATEEALEHVSKQVFETLLSGLLKRD